MDINRVWDIIQYNKTIPDSCGLKQDHKFLFFIIIHNIRSKQEDSKIDIVEEYRFLEESKLILEGYKSNLDNPSIIKTMIRIFILWGQKNHAEISLINEVSRLLEDIDFQLPLYKCVICAKEALDMNT
jgi:hypothetical protein